MAKFLKLALNNEDITVYGAGDQTRTFCFIDDNLDACLTAMKANKFVNDVVNIGNDELITIFELAKKIIEITNSKSKIIHLPALKEGDMTRRQPDLTNMKMLLNRNMLPIEEGIRRILTTK
jgi:UDP-glucose 4-epimerase